MAIWDINADVLAKVRDRIGDDVTSIQVDIMDPDGVQAAQEASLSVLGSVQIWQSLADEGEVSTLAVNTGRS